MKKTVLLTGGAGYIGSHTAYLLHTLGYQLVIVDTLHHHQVFSPAWATVIKADIAQPGILASIFQQYPIHAVMHFAGFIEVGESVKYPDQFYHNNVVATLHLLDAMRQHDVNTIIFSSTCAVYGTPVYVPMDEVHPFGPVSPYGKTKLAIEYILQDYAQAFGLRYAALRYFNAAGALPQQGLGEWHNPETHVIPLLLRAIQQQKTFTILGDDYDTPDGTCIRDYVHVLDIAQAHILALEYLERGGPSDVFNLGTGTGYSVRELIEAAQNVCGRTLITTVASRRPGDAPVLVADAHKVQSVLGWQPQHSDLNNILATAWAWEQRHLPL